MAMTTWRPDVGDGLLCLMVAVAQHPPEPLHDWWMRHHRPEGVAVRFGELIQPAEPGPRLAKQAVRGALGPDCVGDVGDVLAVNEGDTNGPLSGGGNGKESSKTNNRRNDDSAASS